MLRDYLGLGARWNIRLATSERAEFCIDDGVHRPSTCKSLILAEKTSSNPSLIRDSMCRASPVHFHFSETDASVSRGRAILKCQWGEERKSINPGRQDKQEGEHGIRFSLIKMRVSLLRCRAHSLFLGERDQLFLETIRPDNWNRSKLFITTRRGAKANARRPIENVCWSWVGNKFCRSHWEFKTARMGQTSISISSTLFFSPFRERKDSFSNRNEVVNF